MIIIKFLPIKANSRILMKLLIKRQIKFVFILAHLFLTLQLVEVEPVPQRRNQFSVVAAAWWKKTKQRTTKNENPKIVFLEGRFQCQKLGVIHGEDRGASIFRKVGPPNPMINLSRFSRRLIIKSLTTTSVPGTAYAALKPLFTYLRTAWD